MSGHSKWANIHREKEVTDQKRGQEFTKISNAIIVAVRDSGGVTDPGQNFKLRLAMEKARSLNMPKENIQRAIDRAAGKGEGIVINEVVYEGYGPGGVGMLVETATDNKQRTIQEIKNIFDRSGGNITSPGAVAFNFKKVGTIIVPFSGDKDEAILKIIDFGAEEVEEGEEGELVIHVDPNTLEATKEALIKGGFTPKSLALEMKPINTVPVTDKKIAEQVFSLIDKLESMDDVQKVYANFDIPDEFILEESKRAGE